MPTPKTLENAAAIIAENDRLRKASVEILLETQALREKLGSRYR